MSEKNTVPNGDSKVSGHCLCGDIQFQYTGKVNWTAHCHCSDCRRQCGSVVATFISVRKSEFHFSKGTTKTFESSVGVKRSFCGNCGTPMTYEAIAFPKDVHVHLGTLIKPEKFPAQIHVFESEKLSWLKIDDQTRRFDTLPKAPTKI